MADIPFVNSKFSILNSKFAVCKNAATHTTNVDEILYLVLEIYLFPPVIYVLIRRAMAHNMDNFS